MKRKLPKGGESHERTCVPKKRADKKRVGEMGKAVTKKEGDAQRLEKKKTGGKRRKGPHPNGLITRGKSSHKAINYEREGDVGGSRPKEERIWPVGGDWGKGGEGTQEKGPDRKKKKRHV